MKRISSEPLALERLQPWDIAEALLPEYSEQQYQDLEEFLASGGQLAPIVIAEDGRIVDGYNRWRTAKRLKLPQIECDIYSYDHPEEMEIHAIVLNSKRRHLNKLQVARAAVRLAKLLEPAEPLTHPPATAEIPVSESEPAAAVTAPAAPVFHPDQTEKEVSLKLGVSHSTVKQVSKVDKSGDEWLITAMEDKVITIKQAADIAELDEELRRPAIKAIDEEKRKNSNYAGMFSKTCNDCLKKLQSSRKKFKNAEFSGAECNEMKASIIEVISEAKSLMEMLSIEISAGGEVSAPTNDADDDNDEDTDTEEV